MEKLSDVSEKFCCSLERCPWLRRCFRPRNSDELLKNLQEPAVKEGRNKVERKVGSILEATEEYVAHQCNCCMHGKPIEGVAKAIYDKFPSANPYAKREADPTEIDRPGTANVVKPVVNLYAQFAPGKPASLEATHSSKWHKQFSTAKDKGLLSVGGADTSEERYRWFQQCLEGLPNQLKGATSIAFPSGIGCGLAGGDWEKYTAEIEKFAEANPRIRVVIYEFKKSD